jgi:hypothetical protein
VRKLGVPTVVDRLIQQAMAQILTPIFDPEFSESSFGFRPGRSAHDAVRRAHDHQQAGKQWVVDLDLQQFFDKERHREDHCHRSCRISCSTTWTRNWSAGDTASAGMQMMLTSTFGVDGQGSGRCVR